MDFVHALMEMQSGRVADEINRQWKDLMGDILQNAGPGKITLQFKVTPKGVDGQGRITQVEVDHDVKVVKPKRRTGASFFFTTADGQLSRKDQRQQELEMVMGSVEEVK
jgi:hypothetical protein